VVEAVAMKDADEFPAGIEADAGTVRAVEELESETVAAPGLDRVTVQVAEAPPPRLAGEHDNAATPAAATSDSEAVRELPLSEAVTMAV
jgi:hypothetical protein